MTIMSDDYYDDYDYYCDHDALSISMTISIYGNITITMMIFVVNVSL